MTSTHPDSDRRQVAARSLAGHVGLLAELAWHRLRGGSHRRAVHAQPWRGDAQDGVR